MSLRDVRSFIVWVVVNPILPPLCARIICPYCILCFDLVKMGTRFVPRGQLCKRQNVMTIFSINKNGFKRPYLPKCELGQID